ncbi:uncharacterized protein HMPREF1541_07836 [Cyphellophora europaea CBS 101466]|uniref:Dipeptidyl-peptidase V n=1 Tax=Cyphellophora europaea (strain CBS 101466) TaxID=1220924 RepID=W2RM91_CYPE1|nr:uncharacterized protein HMPREF1541_07836 [Cyphellophora europaea CBS 101466]ETN36849.1 hypothetical protein HMPREF1541_07836 [Cyphellophora europaea CBS 101466]
MAGIMWSALAAVVLPLVTALTPEGMIAAPRRSEIVPNPTGEWGLFSATNYSWEDHESTAVWNLLNLTSGEVTYLADGSEISEVVWTGSENASTAVIYVNGTNEEADGGISIYSGDVTSLSDATLLGSLPAPYAGLKLALTESGDIHFLMYCKAYPNGTAYNPELVPEPLTTAQIYTTTWVRHWDTWLDETRNNLFAGVLSADGDSFSFDGNLTNLQQGIGNVIRADTPDSPTGGPETYDISPDGQLVAWWTRNIDRPVANHTQAFIWLQPFDGSAEAAPINPLDGSSTPPNAKGYSSVPVFSPDSQYIAYFQMDTDGYESDRNKLYVANANLDDPNITVLAEDWDRTPDNLKWANDGQAIWVTASEAGQGRLFGIPLSASADFQPTNITDLGTIAAFYVLPDDNILISDSKVWSSRDVYTISPEGELVTDLFHSNEVDEELSGLSAADYSQFYYPGNFTDIQSHIIYPADFDPNQTYPLAYIIHGGPQVPHSNAWSTRWNFKVWADQGYVVVAPNPTGSPGFGQAFTDAIQNNWGGSPYDDIVKGWEYVDANFDYIDTDNGIEAGASYGGYMTNWIQGHDLGRKFKALVTHDGSTSTLNQYASEELFFMQHDFNGTLWENRDNYDRWNPLDYASNWATPHFIVHNTLDYRLPESEGIMLFNILQERGVPSKFLNFPDENHWVLNRENSLVWHQQIFGWINYYSGISDVSPFE